MPLQEEDILQGRYRVVRSIKSGGMGAVYEAIDSKLAGTACAIKEVLPAALQGPDAQYVLQSFDKEVQALANLEHPNIPRVRDYFEQDGSRFIVLDLVKGKSLDEELREHLKITQTPMDPAVVALDMVSVLETLHYLHTRRPRIVHRDVKPANLIRDDTGRVKLVDFGIARALESQRPQTQVGTPGYCAPEQMSGKAEPRSDVYSVGATLYHLCSGKTPPAFCFDELELDLPDHPGLAPIVAKATAMKPDRRYASAEDMAQALRSWLKGDKPAPGPPSPTVLTPSPPTLPLAQPSQDRLLYAAIAVLIALLGAFFLWVARQNSQTGPALSQPGPSSTTPSPQPALSPGPATTPKPVVAVRTPQPVKPRPTPQPSHSPHRPKPRLPKPIPAETPRLDSSAYPTYQGSLHPDPRPTGNSPEPVADPLPSEPPTERPLPQGGIAGFTLQRTVSDGGGEYVLAGRSPLVKVTTHHFIGQSIEEIRRNSATYVNSHINPHPSPSRTGQRIVTDDMGQYQAFHIEPGVMYDIQIHPKPPNPAEYLAAVDQFIRAYPKVGRRRR